MMKASTVRPIDGILLLDKPLGLSSNAALQRVKRLLAASKAGHTGSLDPLASGMLPICLGKATKLSTALLGAHKCYRFRLRLGARMSTGDLEGEVVERCAVPQISAELIEAALRRFLGPQLQVPPMYSALKFKGQRLYRLARQGIEVQREPRPIQIDLLELERWAEAEIEVRVICSKGTYVRVLGEDIARSLGSCGHLAMLRRLWVEPFREEQMVTLQALELATDERQREGWLLREPNPQLDQAVVRPKGSG